MVAAANVIPMLSASHKPIPALAQGCRLLFPQASPQCHKGRLPPRLRSLGDSCQERSPLSGAGGNLTPPPRDVEALGLAPEAGLSSEVVETLLNARAPSTRKLGTGEAALALPGKGNLCPPLERKSSSLFVCFWSRNKENPVCKQRLGHWVVEAFTQAYEVHGIASPLGVRAHSTRGIASSTALAMGVPLQEICAAASWSSPDTFIRFTPGSQVLQG
ncbi:hypothetical protein QTP70_018068 [Hemibagrus guttatus]|uniref:Tyr recombinase domain-containing protein n=1 Tax=Hemibagrus guttatus TaxID=175788 RepID=A0AAE0R684_9TELE|nr:hypothetical protein QTP70_018068 [Hemibagrus guttatus]